MNLSWTLGPVRNMVAVVLTARNGDSRDDRVLGFTVMVRTVQYPTFIPSLTADLDREFVTLAHDCFCVLSVR